MLLATVLACVPYLAQAQQFDSGWQIVDAKDLPDVEYSGAGVRVNNLLIAQVEAPKSGDRMGSYTFSASTVKRTPGRRSVRIELVGMRSDGKPSVVSVIAVNIYDEAPNKSSSDQHRFLAIPAEVNDTQRFMIRVVVP
jgi:hypothetical protein